MIWLLLVLAPVVTGLMYLLLRKQRLSIAQFFLICALGTALVLLLLRFLPQLSWVPAVLLPFLLRFLSSPGSTNIAGTMPSGGKPQTSRVRSDWFDMQLDHASGHLDGQILQGPFATQQLSSLSLQQLLELREEPLDADSRQILETWLARSHPGWQEAGGKTESAAGAMSREEALALLGLEGAPGAEEILAAHKRLVQKLHPDRGGSDYLTSKLNAARSLLLDSVHD